MSEQTTAEATTVASAAEEQAATLNEVSDQAHDLHERARDLRETTEEFEVDADAEAGDDVVGGADGDSVGEPAAGGSGETGETAFTFGADEEPSDAAPASTDGGTAHGTGESGEPHADDSA